MKPVDYQSADAFVSVYYMGNKAFVSVDYMGDEACGLPEQWSLCGGGLYGQWSLWTTRAMKPDSRRDIRRRKSIRTSAERWCCTSSSSVSSKLHTCYSFIKRGRNTRVGRMNFGVCLTQKSMTSQQFQVLFIHPLHISPSPMFFWLHFFFSLLTE